ncbi:hypothetical protein GOV12_01450 [Candidatus Pacearchaeota archaeon]|nr:hypothetical protein [Candidatus Pacearchaeota archaeon]
MTIKPEIEEELRAKFLKIRENKILILGVIIGIIGSLISGVINDLIKNSVYYPWEYLFILIFILLILIFLLLIPYLNWKRFQYKLNKRIKEIKKVIDKVNNHYNR